MTTYRPNLQTLANPTAKTFTTQTLLETLPAASQLALVNLPKKGDRVPHASFNTKYECELPGSSIKWGAMLNRTFCVLPSSGAGGGGEKTNDGSYNNGGGGGGARGSEADAAHAAAQRAAFCGKK